MSHPDILRENIDGEALEWAASLVAERPEPHRLVIVLSDGAPVDDATLTYNGPSLLEKHLLSVISRISGDGRVMLGAVGIGFDVNRYYNHSTSAKTLTDLPQSLIDMMRQMVRITQQQRDER